MNQIIILAEGAGSSLPFPTFVTGAIAFGVFILLGAITWSYRDVANRHDHKSGSDAHH